MAGSPITERNLSVYVVRSRPWPDEVNAPRRYFRLGRRLGEWIVVRNMARALRLDARRQHGRAGATLYLEGHAAALDRVGGRVPGVAKAVKLAIRSERARTFYRLRRRDTLDGHERE